ncbi:MAG: heavy metal sensor histidine kinase [Betaproteobacteria bacterium]|nr:heavy metal sensor histidine kinase [Betaproteobacteria bacterium]
MRWRALLADGQSLGTRLSRWLALQGLIAALAVSGTVYAVTLWVLQSRQHEELALKSAVVRHALAETAGSSATEELQHKLKDFLAGHEDMKLSIMSRDGMVLFSAPQASEGGDAASASRFLQVSWEATWPAGAAGGVRVVLGLDVSRDQDLLQRLGWILLAASLIAAGLVSVTGFLLVRRGLLPVQALAAQVDAVALGRPGLRLDGAGQPLELRPLVERFNALLMRVERAYAQLEGFNADVAHELRTPLTTLIGSSELALQRERPAAELQDVIAENLEDLRRLAIIVNDMLFLSQADRGASARRSPVTSLAAELGEIIEYHEAALQERSLSAVCDGDATGAFDLSLLRRALSNLLSNATRYATPGSTIRVRIASEGGRIRIWVENEGSPIEQEHLPRLFDRFYRVERSRRQVGASNHGLGLAIVAAIARMHQGEPFARSADGITTIGLDVPSSAATA